MESINQALVQDITLTLMNDRRAYDQVRQLFVAVLTEQKTLGSYSISRTLYSAARSADYCHRLKDTNKLTKFSILYEMGQQMAEALAHDLRDELDPNHTFGTSELTEEIQHRLRTQINELSEKANHHFNWEKAINKDIPWQTITYINEEDITQLSDSKLISALQQLESEHTSLSSIQAKSSRINAIKAHLEQGLLTIASELDSRPHHQETE